MIQSSAKFKIPTSIQTTNMDLSQVLFGHFLYIPDNFFQLSCHFA